MDSRSVDGDAGDVPGALRLLGPVELHGKHGPVTLGGAKERTLLAILALRAGEVVPDAALVDALWGDDPPRTAGKTLQNYVLRLRHTLRDCEGIEIATRHPGYLLDAASYAIDLHAVEDLVERAGRAARANDDAGAVRLLRSALGYWRGASLGEFAAEPFARVDAARLDELRAAAEEDLAAAELALGRHHQLTGRLETMVASFPLRERRWALLMAALFRDGRQAEALAAYRRLCEVLARELGVTPGPAIRRVHAAVLHQDDDALQRADRAPSLRGGAAANAPRMPCFDVPVGTRFGSSAQSGSVRGIAAGPRAVRGRP